MKIYCTGCKKDVEARLTNGEERYPHRKDLYSLPFWKCDTCGNYVGCHHRSDNPTRPLGCIATPEILEERKKLHYILDPLWRKGVIERSTLYRMISREIGHRYHTGEIRSVEEALKIKEIAFRIKDELLQNPCPTH